MKGTVLAWDCIKHESINGSQSHRVTTFLRIFLHFSSLAWLAPPPSENPSQHEVHPSDGMTNLVQAQL